MMLLRYYYDSTFEVMAELRGREEVSQEGKTAQFRVNF